MMNDQTAEELILYIVENHGEKPPFPIKTKGLLNKIAELRNISEQENLEEFQQHVYHSQLNHKLV